MAAGWSDEETHQHIRHRLALLLQESRNQAAKLRRMEINKMSDEGSHITLRLYVADSMTFLQACVNACHCHCKECYATPIAVWLPITCLK